MFLFPSRVQQSVAQKANKTPAQDPNYITRVVNGKNTLVPAHLADPVAAAKDYIAKRGCDPGSKHIEKNAGNGWWEDLKSNLGNVLNLTQKFVSKSLAMQAQTEMENTQEQLAALDEIGAAIGSAYDSYGRTFLEKAALGTLSAFDSIAIGSSTTAYNNYLENSKKDITERMIHGQGVDDAGNLKYGFASMSHSGCEIIGTYNALQLLGQSPSLATLIYQYEISGAKMGGGYLGTNPFQAFGVLRQYDVSYSEYTHTDDLEQAMEDGDVAMVSIWNKSGDITSGLHTFTVQKVNGEFVVYNRYNSVSEIQ